MKINADKVIQIVKEAAVLFYDRNRVSHVSVKGFGNFVTDADKAVQKYIGGKLAEAYPDIQFFAEEKDNGDVDVNGDFWLLDPIDGTLNLLHDFAHSAISLGFAEGGRLTFGVIYDPYRDEMFRAEKGCGAFMMEHVWEATGEELSVSNCVKAGERSEDNGTMQKNESSDLPGFTGGRVWFPIHVSSAKALSDSVVTVGTAPYNRDELGDKYFNAVHDVFMRSQDIRRFGAAVLDLAWVACGRADAYFEHVYPWDRAAGTVIVQEAGGKVSSLDGSEVPITSFHDICAGPEKVVDEIVSIAGPVFYK